MRVRGFLSLLTPEDVSPVITKDIPFLGMVHDGVVDSALRNASVISVRRGLALNHANTYL